MGKCVAADQNLKWNFTQIFIAERTVGLDERWEGETAIGEKMKIGREDNQQDFQSTS